MIIISSHAYAAMEDHHITKEEISAALDHGECVIQQQAGQEMRYGNELALKDKTIVVIYVYRKGTTRVITCYPIKRKEWK